MLYKTNCAISYKGDRVARGATVELTADEAKNLGDDVSILEAQPQVEVAPEAKPISEMSLPELKAEAEARGIKATGSKADLIERLTLSEGRETLEETT